MLLFRNGRITVAETTVDGKTVMRILLGSAAVLRGYSARLVIEALGVKIIWANSSRKVMEHTPIFEWNASRSSDPRPGGEEWLK
jgi:hypothetical protein